MAGTTILRYDKNDKRATTMLQLLLASGLFTEQKSGMELAMDDIAEGRINNYSSLEELKAKFANVQR